LSKKALILGDNAAVRLHFKRLINAQPGWKVVGEMASEKAMTGNSLKHPPDVVIAELNRLDASLLPSISTIRAAFSASKLLAVSAQQDSRLVLRIIHAGANGFMIMDRAPEELAGAIRTIAAGGMFLSPGIAGLEGRRPR
jgi:two-component system invasion response regulator UvrY